MKKNLVITAIMSIATTIWATNTPSHLLPGETLKAMTTIETDKEVKSDFRLPSHDWSILTAKDLRGKHEIFDIKNNKEHIFLYRVSPGAEIGVKEHDTWEEVVIINGSLEWLNASGQTQQILSTGAYVNRPPHIKHGPFKAGDKGCLMYVRMYAESSLRRGNVHM